MFPTTFGKSACECERGNVKKNTEKISDLFDALDWTKSN